MVDADVKKFSKRGSGRENLTPVRFVFRIGLILLLLSRCAVFRAGDELPEPPAVAEHRFGSVTYEMVNWANLNEDNQAGDFLVTTLSDSAEFEQLNPGVGSSDWFVQIILEEYPGKKESGAAVLDHPVGFLAQNVNNIAFGQTIFIFPIIRYLERKITFAVWRGGELKQEYTYQSDAWVIIGWASILLAFASESEYLRTDMGRVARQFAADAARDGLLSGPAPRRVGR